MKSMKLVSLLVSTLLVKCSSGLTKKASEGSYSFLSETNPFKYSEVEDLINFGDSYTTINVDYDTMVNNGENLVGSRNWPTFLIRQHPMKMWNYAFGGAVVTQRVIGGFAISPPMTVQYQHFLKNMSKGGKFDDWDGNKTLVTVWFGINDILGKPKILDKYSSQEIDEMIFTAMFDYVQGVYREGARHFMFMTVPPMEKFPYFVEEVETYLTEDVPNFNAALLRYAKTFQSTHPDTNVFVYDAHEEFNYLLDHPSDYGFENTLEMCGDEDVKYHLNGCTHYNHFWKDWFHPSLGVQKILAEDIEVYLSAQENESRKLNGLEEIDPNTPYHPESSCWSLPLGYPCCQESTTKTFEKDEQGEWGIEQGNWCGIPLPSTSPSTPSTLKPELCWGDYLGIPCCNTKVCHVSYYEDEDGQWSIDQNQWCLLTIFNTMCQ